jgi:flavin reductase (DIM6/NTAB) family NADH-FMN oxidoreductase RutF
MSREPPLYGVMLSKARKEALEAIIDEGVFVVNFIDQKQEKAAAVLSDHRTVFEDPFAAAGLHRARAAHVACSRLQEAVGWAECELFQQHDAGDHVLVIGRVIHTELPQPLAKRLFHVENDKFTTTV